MKYVKNVNSKNSDVILILGNDGFMDCFYYVKVSSVKRIILKNASPGESLNIADLGEILEKGYAEPSPKVMKQMEEEYGIIFPQKDNEDDDFYPF